MSLIPDFGIGVWNAWVIMLYLFLISFLMMLNKGASKDEIREHSSGIIKSQFMCKYNKVEKRALLLYHNFVNLL
jgi:hypothetical protein